MKSDDYPALYRAASKASAAAQSGYLWCIRLYGVISVAAAALAHFHATHVAAIISLIFLLLGLGISALMAFYRYDSRWYRARAVAESVKTSTWRYMLRADPFSAGMGEESARKHFVGVLNQILKEHKSLSLELSGVLTGAQAISQFMNDVRARPLQERISFYQTARIEEQRSWYAEKSEKNKRWGRFWFCTFVVIQMGAIVFAACQIAWPTVESFPIGTFGVAAAAILGWTLIKRFRELAAAYGMAALEIGFALEQIGGAKDESGFSQFVGDTENAFSREHTQWIARKDT